MPATPDGAARTLRPASPDARPLTGLLAQLPSLRPDRPVEGRTLTGCTLDSRAVQPGDLYAALPGARAHGADFAAQAAAAGARAFLTDPAGAERCAAYDVPVLVSDDPRGVLGEAARWVHGDPAAGMTLLGVTGTNGKTTNAFLLEAGLRAAGRSTGLLGTVLTRIGDDVVPSVRTTPEAPDLQALLAVMRERGTSAVAMEVSSHALTLGRVDGVVFDVAVVPVGLDPGGGEARVVRFAREAEPRADLVLLDGVLTFEGEELMPADEVRLRGAHNRANAMAAAALALARGIAPGAVREALATFSGVAHRLEEVARRRGVLYVNDSKATNPDSARVGIEAFPGGVHAILGGSLKGGGFGALREVIRERCRAAYLVGEAEEQLARELEGTVALHRCGTLERAFEAAAAAARPGEVVLLSPACASFDAFSNYEHRGERFRELAQALAEASGGA